MSILRRIVSTATLFVLALFATSTMLHAQLSSRGTITGTVSDSTGAVVPSADVTFTDQLTKVSIPTQTNGDGLYTSPSLTSSTYSVTIAKTGFKTYTVTGIVLHPTETVQVNGTLAVGATSENVTVGATSTYVELSTPENAAYISGDDVSSLPMNGRNYQAAAGYLPGVINTSQGSALGTGGRNTSSALVINGMTVARTFYALDGVWNENTGNMTANSVVPNPDSIEEVRVLEDNFSAQYSLMGSSVILAQTKSGTNAFHGTGWEFVRNDDLNAKNYFTTTPPLIPPYKQNIFGFNIGGPLFIPHVYNTDRKKTFFFWDESWVILHQPGQNLSEVPTPNQIAGCFLSPIKDPVDGQSLPDCHHLPRHGSYRHVLPGPDGEDQYQLRGVPERAVSDAQLLLHLQRRQLRQPEAANDLPTRRSDQDRPLLHAPTTTCSPSTLRNTRTTRRTPRVMVRLRSTMSRTLPTTSWRRWR
jgi:hypothetical protein